ncbi:activity-dependent neuroprotector homeobox protein 2 isoform X2 [Hemicordylus capensis]|uniref:activity-dependent neuroprotector homeobox protein 2 isoform X2 n=1 Tax=Hemicordylus capensis TaxID=884348 RepID=UPI002302F7CD|nr:activity-dependent neuroprotector homeobox protein 2 isoform X2 [Hemicordylus capensis]
MEKLNMFQIPVQNLDNIRKARKKVKGVLVNVGLDSCRELLQTLKSFDPGEKYFCNTSWSDVSPWESMARRRRYRTNPYCCSLCKFSTKFLNSFKNHLNRCHEDEMDQELVVPCPECTFASHSKTVGKHLRMFHSKKKIQNYNVSGGMRQFRSDVVNFVCQKCQFTDTLYYNTKKHVLVTHFQNLISTYFEERPDESEENFTDHYCKKCNAFANSRDSLIYHVLTSEVHKDLENILRPVISVQPKKPGQAKSLQIVSIAPKPSAVGATSPLIPTTASVTSAPTTSCLQRSLSSVSQNQNMLPTKAVQNTVGPLSVSSASSSLTHTSSPTSVAQSRITLMSGSCPGGPNNVALQPTVPQPVFVSHRLPLKQPVRPGVLCLNQPTGTISRSGPPGVVSFSRPVRPTLLPVNPSIRTMSSPVVSGALPMTPPAGSLNTSIGTSVLPVNRPSAPGVLAVNRPVGSLNHSNGPGVLPVTQTITSGVLQFNAPGVLPVNHSVGPGILQFNQPVAPGVLPVNQSVRPGISQNTTLLAAGPILRQLIPTGKQVNGIPTYTLAPVSVALPVPPGGGVSTAAPSQVPVQLMQSGTVSQLPQAPATVPPSSVVTSLTNTAVKTSLSASEISLALKQAKQWKTCPVCSELFPSNVYQVHMEVAHKFSTVRTEVTFEIDKVAASAPFLRWLKDRTVRCFSCKCFLSDAELIKHLFTHGLACLFCTSTFHDLKCLVDHTKNVHKGKKKLHADYDDKGFQLESDSEGGLVFPHFDFCIASPKEELGEREVHLAVLAGVNSRTVIPLYIKLQLEATEKIVGNKKVSTCPFCYGTFTSTEAYEIHLKERHHIMPTLHTILKSPAFKCIHCCGVYTGNMTLTAIAVHLLRCRSAPKDSNPTVKMQLELDDEKDPLLVNGEKPDAMSLSVKRKQSDHLYAVTEDSKNEDQPFLIINSGTAQVPAKEVNFVPSKRQKTDHKTETKGQPSTEDLHILALNPKPFQHSSNEAQKRFLARYFHKKPYPTKKELELLSSVFCEWKADVASFFGRKRHTCLKAIKNLQPSVLLGFSMSELKNVKHRLSLKCESEVL